MAYEITFENDGRGVVTRFAGDISGTEMIASAELVYRQDKSRRLCYQIADFTAASGLTVSEAQLRALAFIDQQAAQYYSEQAIAIVGSRELFRGADRRYGIYADVWAGFKIRQLQSMEQARAWIEKAVDQN